MHRNYMLGTAAVASLMLLAACNRNETAYNAPADNNPPAQTATATPPADQTAVNPPPDQTAQNDPAPGSTSNTVAAAKDAVRGAVGTVSAELTSSTKGFIDAAAMSDMYEVQAGQMAVMRAKSPDLKMFAQHMIDDHTKSSNELKTIITKEVPNWMPPKELDTRRQGMLDDLKGVSDQDFDNRYITQQENAHNEAVILIRGYAKDGDNAEIKQFAAKVLPTVQMHLDMINDIDRKHRAGNAQAQARSNNSSKTR
jgi:putative membrane protein